MTNQEMFQERFSNPGGVSDSTNNDGTNAGGAISSSNMQVWSKNVNC